jgi:hypothetical protein
MSWTFGGETEMLILIAAVVSVDPQRSFLLQDFPTGFTLWEHIKKTETADGTGRAPKTKSHAAGGHDRMDAYLYGHHGKKRFRSPGEFFPHLLWLLTDESKNYENCRCVCCCPDVLQPAETRATIARAEKKAKAQESVTKSPAQKPKATAKSAENTSTAPVYQNMMPTSENIITKPSASVPTHNAATRQQTATPVQQYVQPSHAANTQPARTQVVQHHATSNQQQHQEQHNLQPSYNSHVPSQDHYQAQDHQSISMGMQPQISQQVDYAMNPTYQQFSTPDIMDFNQTQQSYMPTTNEQYDQFLMQPTLGQTGFDSQLDNTDVFMDDMHQWVNMGQQWQGQNDGSHQS